VKIDLGEHDPVALVAVENRELGFDIFFCECPGHRESFVAMDFCLFASPLLPAGGQGAPKTCHGFHDKRFIDELGHLFGYRPPEDKVLAPREIAQMDETVTGCKGLPVVEVAGQPIHLHLKLAPGGHHRTKHQHQDHRHAHSTNSQTAHPISSRQLDETPMPFDRDQLGLGPVIRL